MAVPVMLVMNMGVLMLDGVMGMRVVVALGEMRPQAQGHQRPGDQQLGGRPFVQHNQ